jgi:hypothetical protein
VIIDLGPLRGTRNTGTNQTLVLMGLLGECQTSKTQSLSVSTVTQGLRSSETAPCSVMRGHGDLGEKLGVQCDQSRVSVLV